MDVNKYIDRIFGIAPAYMPADFRQFISSEKAKQRDFNAKYLSGPKAAGEKPKAAGVMSSASTLSVEEYDARYEAYVASQLPQLAARKHRESSAAFQTEHNPRKIREANSAIKRDLEELEKELKADMRNSVWNGQSAAGGSRRVQVNDVQYTRNPRVIREARVHEVKRLAACVKESLYFQRSRSWSR